MSAVTVLHSPLIADSGIVDANNPWPGLEAFYEADASLFHGRDTETEALLRLVQRARLTVLFSLSGLGKSSLLQAGMFPRLRHENILPIYIRLDYSPPDPDLVSQVLTTIAREATAVGVETPIVQEGRTLWEYFHHQDADFWNSRNRLLLPLLVFDQFEELFTLGISDANHIAASERLLIELADLIEGRPPVALKAFLDANPDQTRTFAFSRHHYKVLFSLREDFLPDLEGLRNRMGSIASNRWRLRRMDGEAALAVVAQARHLIEPEVAEQIVRFVAAVQKQEARLTDLEVEPALLSVVCRELNNKRQAYGEPRITADLLEGNREQILSEFYERCFADLGLPVRTFIEERLLTVSGYRDSVALENALNTPGISQEDINHLVQRRLLRIEERGGVHRLELTHDLLTNVVATSRDRRHQMEAAEKEREARHMAEAREQQARQELKRSRMLGAVFLVLALLAMGAAGWAWWAQKAAKAAKHTASRSQSLGLTALAQIELQEYNATNGVLLALEALPKSISKPDRPYIVEAAQKLYEAISKLHEHAVLRGHEYFVHYADFSLDGQYLVTTSGDKTARLWDVKTGKQLFILTGHDAYVYHAAFSPDGQRVITASQDKTARLWNAKTGEQITVLAGHQAVVYHATFSPDGQRVVTVSWDGTARLWDASSGQQLSVLAEHEGEIRHAAFSPDSTLVAIAGRKTTVWDVNTSKEFVRLDGAMYTAFSPDGRHLVTTSRGSNHLWDVYTGKQLYQFTGGAYAAFSPDGRRLVTLPEDEDNAARLWDVETGKELIVLRGHKNTVLYAAFSPNGQRVVTASEDKTARLWDTGSGQQLAVFAGHEENVNYAASWDKVERLQSFYLHKEYAVSEGRKAGITHVAFSPDGQYIATTSRDGTARLWDAGPTKTSQQFAVLTGHEAGVKHAAFSPDGQRVVTASEDGTARLWDVNTGKQLFELPGHTATVNHAAFSPDGQYLVTASSDNTAQVWEVNSDKQPKLLAVLTGHKDWLDNAAFSPDSRRVVTVSGDNTARLWEVNSGKQLVSLPHRGIVRHATFSPSGQYVATASQDGTVFLWNVNNGQQFVELVGHSQAYYVDFSPSGQRVVTAGGYDNTARLWDANTGKQLATLEHREAVLHAAFSPDGQRVVTASQDGMARLWDVNTGKQLFELPGHTATVNHAAFSPDGQYLVTASSDNTAQVWEVNSDKQPKLLAVLTGHEAWVNYAAFSPDSRRVVTVSGFGKSKDNTVRLWPVFPSVDVLIDHARKIVPRQLTPEQRQQFYLDN